VIYTGGSGESYRPHVTGGTAPGVPDPVLPVSPTLAERHLTMDEIESTRYIDREASLKVNGLTRQPLYQKLMHTHAVGGRWPITRGGQLDSDIAGDYIRLAALPSVYDTLESYRCVRLSVCPESTH